MKTILILLPAAAAPLLASAAKAAAPAAQGAPNLFRLSSDNTLGVPMQIVLLLTLLTVLPAVLVSITPFLRMTIVLHFLRQAIGTQTVPSNQVLLGLSLFLSLLIMQPVVQDVYTKAWAPMERGDMTGTQAFEEGAKPLKTFLLRFAREKDIQLFIEITHAPRPQTPADVDLKILIPAYILSELKTGFQIGAILFLPFLVIDIVVASVTLSIGMIQLPPVMLSAPLKILLFVIVDGWNLVIGSLVKSFYQTG